VKSPAGKRLGLIQAALWLALLTGCIVVLRESWAASGKLHTTLTDHPWMAVFSVLGLGVATIAIVSVILLLGRAETRWPSLVLRIAFLCTSIAFLWRAYRFCVDVFLVGQGR
jgi:hypothetical protein